MKWDRMRRSDNVEDVRGSGGLPIGATGMSLGGLVIALVASLVLGVNPVDVLVGLQQAQQENAPTQPQTSPINDRDSALVRAVLGDTEDTWSKIFEQQLGSTYQEPKLVLFRSGVESACGFAQSATGPFYCPRDDKVYLDMNFFQQIRATAGDDADFARAYAIAHEIGHHVQNQLGITDQVREAQSRSNRATANALSVRLELQADCLAGVWGHYTAERGLIGNADLKTAMDTATQIGDDYLQKQAHNHIVPDSFTHGSSQQRVSWFSQGLKTGTIKQCNTFKAGI